MIQNWKNMKMNLKRKNSINMMMEVMKNLKKNDVIRKIEKK